MIFVIISKIKSDLSWHRFHGIPQLFLPQTLPRLVSPSQQPHTRHPSQTQQTTQSDHRSLHTWVVTEWVLSMLQIDNLTLKKAGAGHPNHKPMKQIK